MQEVDEATAERSALPRPGPLAFVLLLPIYLYRKLLGPLLQPSCRFYPSCSAYAVEALARHGAFGGLYLAVRRLLRCGPWHPGGIDEVPERFQWRASRPDSDITDITDITDGAGGAIPRTARQVRRDSSTQE